MCIVYLCRKVHGFIGIASSVSPASVEMIGRRFTVTVKARQHLKGQQPLPRAGLLAGEALLNANASSFGFIVLVTDGEHNRLGDPVTTAEEIRLDNTTTIFAVGVGVCERERLFRAFGEEPVLRRTIMKTRRDYVCSCRRAANGYQSAKATLV